MRLIKAEVTISNTDDDYKRSFKVEYDPDTDMFRTEASEESDMKMSQGLATLMRERYGPQNRDRKPRRGGSQVQGRRR